jgi:hypothetical protein
MNQRGGLKGLTGLLLGQPLCGETAQFVVDDRQELLSSITVALLNGG